MREQRQAWCAAAAVMMWLTAAVTCHAAEGTWWDAAWAYRIKLTCDAGGGDVAWVTLQLNGRCAADAHDLRLVDGDGTQRPIEVLSHDPLGQTTLCFKADEGKAMTTWLYFGNSKAKAQPASAWQPRRGVLLRTYDRKLVNHPTELTELYKEIEQCRLQGAGFRQAISDGYNPFGPSDLYISSYVGYLRIDKPGRYGFATVSENGSWVLLNGKPLVSWTGGHTYRGGEHGEHHAFVELGKGVVRIRYYQETGTGGQMAYLAWQPPGEKHFVPIPIRHWLSVRAAKADSIEARGAAPTACAKVNVVNSYWVLDSQDQQATLVRFVDDSRVEPGRRIVKRQWEFGDGLRGEGREVEHVYFRLGRPVATLTVTDDKGRTDSVTVSPHIYQVDVVAQSYSYGSAGQYEKAAAGYDVTRMVKDDLRLHAQFWRSMDRDRPFIDAASAYVDRFGEQNRDDAAELASGAAEAALHAGTYDPAGAKKWMQWAVNHSDRGLDKAERMVKLAKLLAWDVGDTAEAAKIAERVQQATSKHDNKVMERLERRAMIVMGDAALLDAKYDKAAELYKKAEQIGPDAASGPQRMAKLGGYPYTVENLLARDEYEYALKTIDEWEYEFPTRKLEGLTFFWRGKVLYVRKPGELAMKWLTMSERVNGQGLHVSEAIWLRANDLMAMGRWRDAMDQFMRIKTQYTHSEFFTKADAKMKICREKLK